MNSHHTRQGSTGRHISGKRHDWLLLPALLLAAALLAGCATTRTYADLQPKSINEVRFRDRWMSDHDDDVRVTAAVPSAEETAALFGRDLVAKEIQPIWIKVENHSSRSYYLVAAASDPNYYSPMEAAFTVRSGLSEYALTEMTTY